jgi:ribonuclease PH
LKNVNVNKEVRLGGRALNALREVRLTPNFTEWAEGSVLVEFGKTRVLCNASLDEKVPPFLLGKGRGWLTAEYSMLPRSTHTRSPRESATGKVSGRTQEIQRLIGRSLRAVMDFDRMGERQIVVDCDVLQADGGTRTAAITGSYVAVALACRKLKERGLVLRSPLKMGIAAVSVGVVNGQLMLDLDYSEDSRAEVDFNVVMLDNGELVEVQGTAEGKSFSRATMNSLLDLAEAGLTQLFAAQKAALGS